VVLALAPACALAQSRLKTLPAYEHYERMSREIPGAVKYGRLSVTWQDDGAAFEYLRDGRRYRYDIASATTTDLGPVERPRPPENATAHDAPPGEHTTPPTSHSPPPPPPPPPPPERPRRGRQHTSSVAPDGQLKAFYRDRNLWLSDPDGANERALTTDGSDATRVKYGTANWVYGEELFQNTAIWWSPDSRRVAFYRFDESRLQDYYLALDQTRIQSRMDVEPYMKAGTPNPVVDVLIHDRETGATVTADVRDGQPFTDGVTGHYVYGVEWSADSTQLLFRRTNRLQNIMEFCACDPESGACRVVVREEWLPSWVENSPPLRFLQDGKRFLWISERTGWRNLYLYHLSGELLATLTSHEFEADRIVRVDEERGEVDYLARSGDNPLKLQLHRVGLDGRGNRRLTDPAFHHGVSVAPDGRHFIDVAETHNTPPVTRLMDSEGRCLAELAASDVTKFERLGLKPAELLRFKAADRETDLYGLLHRPSFFDSARKYPLLVNVYAGPGTSAARETFQAPTVSAELGFLVASFDSRSADGRGKRALDAIYGKFGIVEIDDQAAGVRALCDRPYVDSGRVGVLGLSYGGTASALCLLRYPDVFHAACASSAVTDFRNYDTIYTERYLGLPQDKQAAYDAACVLTYAGNLKGRLMLFYGTADDNVHPSNSLQLIQALQKAGKSFDVQVGPDQGHTALGRERMLEFFVEALRPEGPSRHSDQPQ
jgi:dipeptidyl-peptidase-4